MLVSSNTPEGFDYCCPVCRNLFIGQPSDPTGELICPACGSIAFVAVEVYDVVVSATLIKEIPESIVKEHRIFPLRRSGDTIFIATAQVKDADFVGVLSYILDADVRFIIGNAESIEAAIQRVYG